MLGRLVVPGFVALLSCAGCSTIGSGVRMEEERDIEAFTELDVRGSVNVVVHSGSAPSARVVGDDNLVPRVRTELHGEQLQVYVDGSYATSNPLTVFLTTPSLREIDLSGSSAVQADGLSDDSFVFEVSGSGKLTAVGKGKTLKANVSGSGEIDAIALPVADANVKVSGSGRVKSTATSSLTADVSGS
ncbi:MAG: DUF2807 domain-containing protein, partial [Nannocystaceae bacterium]|nr:DUF2807 domain-containing protein [Nannocystaceae bacterium]